MEEKKEEEANPSEDVKTASVLGHEQNLNTLINA